MGTFVYRSDLVVKKDIFNRTVDPVPIKDELGIPKDSIEFIAEDFQDIMEEYKKYIK